MEKTSKEAKHNAEQHLRELDELFHKNFPVGGQANVERAQVLVGQLMKEIKLWQS